MSAEAEPAAVDPGGWAPYLAPGERIVWTGVPGRGLRLRLVDLIAVPFGLIWTSLVVWGGAPLLRGAAGLLGLVVILPFMAAGFWLVIGAPLWDAVVRAHTVYALTDRRVLVATRHLGRRMRSFPVTRDTPAYLGGLFGRSVIFGHERRRVAGGTRRRGSRVMVIEHGFEHLDNPGEVLELLRGVKARRPAGATA